MARGWSLQELAKQIGVSKEAVRLWESGRGVRGEHLARLCMLLELEPLELVEGRTTVNDASMVETLGLELEGVFDALESLQGRIHRLALLLAEHHQKNRSKVRQAGVARLLRRLKETH